MLQVERFFRQNRMLLRQSRLLIRQSRTLLRFDIVAVFGSNVERNFVLSKRRNFTKKIVRHWCRFDIKVEIGRSNVLLCSIRQCFFDIVAGVDGVFAHRTVSYNTIFL